MAISILLETTSAVEFIANGKLIDDATMEISLKVMAIAAVLGPFFYAGTLTYNFLHNLLVTLPSGKLQVFDRQEFVRVTVLYLIATVGYYPLVGTVTVIGGILQDIPAYSKSQAVQKALYKNYEQIGTALHGMVDSSLKGDFGDAASSAGDALDEIANTAMVASGISGAWYGAQDLLVSSAAGIIQWFVEAFAVVLTKLLFVLGPLAAVFSIFPFNKDKFEKWFGIYLNVLCIPLTCALLDSLYNAFLGDSIANFGENDFGSFEIMYIATYCLVPWITSWYVGSSDASKVMSMALAVATTAVAKTSAAAGGSGDLIKDTGKFAKAMTGKAAEGNNKD